MNGNNINSVVIKIIGLLGDLPIKNCTKNENIFIQAGYVEEKDVKNNQFLKDYFYPDFRNIMFQQHTEIGNRRYIKNIAVPVTLIKTIKDENGNEINLNFPLKIAESEIFIFPGYVSLFSLSIEIDSHPVNLETISNVLFIARQFDTMTTDNIKWHEWISKNILCSINLRGDGIKADEYSGSKFKVFCVVDSDNEFDSRDCLLFELATSSKLGSTISKENRAHTEEYFTEIMKNEISVFNNWKALCLFDSFTCLGEGQLNNPMAKKTWGYTYFRIYLFRLFFKYNLYSYSCTIYDEPVKLRKTFETFLNNYNLSHISFNFLANDIFKKSGDALEIDVELKAFQTRINRLSAAIVEQKQSKTNMLLKGVTLLSGVSSIQPGIVFLNLLKGKLKWTNLQFYLTLTCILVLIVGLLVYYVMPEKFKKYFSLRNRKTF